MSPPSLVPESYLRKHLPEMEMIQSPRIKYWFCAAFLGNFNCQVGLRVFHFLACSVRRGSIYFVNMVSLLSEWLGRIIIIHSLWTSNLEPGDLWVGTQNISPPKWWVKSLCWEQVSEWDNITIPSPGIIRHWQFSCGCSRSVFLSQNLSRAAKGSQVWHKRVVKIIHFIGNFSSFSPGPLGCPGYWSRGFAERASQLPAEHPHGLWWVAMEHSGNQHNAVYFSLLSSNRQQDGRCVKTTSSWRKGHRWS